MATNVFDDDGGDVWNGAFGEVFFGEILEIQPIKSERLPARRTTGGLGVRKTKSALPTRRKTSQLEDNR